MKKILKTELILESSNELKSSKGFDKKSKKCGSGILETTIRVLNEDISQKIGRDIGNYINLSFDDLLFFDIKAKETLKNLLCNNIKRLLKQTGIKKNKILIVGLGNEKYACDSLGKKVVENIFITKPYLDRDLISKNKVAEIYAVSLGVYGTTGLESSETIKALCDIIKPNLIVAIDSLVASEAKNLCKSIQLSDTKLSPGGGVGNNRKEISEKILGVKVFAIGVPFVINIDNVEFNNLIVTPKDVEQKVEILSKIISKAINLAFCKLSQKELDEFLL